jgi:hypothetical protein
MVKTNSVFNKLRITDRNLDIYIRADVLTNGIMKQFVSQV